ncbi:DUF1433 domain-containing protein [Listeria sp. W9-0585]|uniref:DUF1433 domain-containing protein n=2 Tax=Listeria rustica TaxID=2713503 RepID=A0A7W1T7B3_9LIST|nr:DUF1433 domain-containing protein [Listeria rustica]
MKKRIIIVGSLCVLVAIAIGGIVIMNNNVENKQEAQMLVEKNRIETYLKYNYKDISNVEITKTGVTPMGIPYIDGYVNGDKNLNFSADIYDGHFEESIDMSAELGALAKYDVDKSVSEIKELD